MLAFGVSYVFCFEQSTLFVWNFVVTIYKNPEIIQNAIDAKITLLQQELGDIENEASHLQNELERLAEEKQWVITTARKEKISDDDMEKQLAAIDFQSNELHRMRDDKLAAIMLQTQTEQLQDWANRYLSNLANSLNLLETARRNK